MSGLETNDEAVASKDARSRIDELLAWKVRKSGLAAGQRASALSSAEVAELIELLDNPSDAFMVAVLADKGAHAALEAAFIHLVPSIWGPAKNSCNPRNYSGAFPGPLMAMMRDRRFAGFLNRWREVCKKWQLDEHALIRAHQHAPARAGAKADSSEGQKPVRGQRPTMEVEVEARWILPPGVRPADVFDGSQVRRKYRSKVRMLIVHAAENKHTYFEGNMLNARQGERWDIFGGTATQSPSWWGRPSRLTVDGEETRASILIAMGAELQRSRTYARYVRQSVESSVQ